MNNQLQNKLDIPKVSVIVPCFKQAQYLDEALQSVLKQTYTNWECIIVNDGSPDNTELVAKEWLEKDHRFKLIYKENGGLSSARNFGIEKAQGKYILPLDADDKIGEKYLEFAINEFQKDINLKVVYCRAEKFGEEQGLWKLQDFSLKGLVTINMIFCTAFFKKEDWSNVEGYDVEMIYGLEDWEFWINLLKNEKESSVKRINEVCFYYRVKVNSMTTDLKENNNKKIMLEYLSVKHADFFVKQLGSFQYLSKKIKNVNNRYNNLINSSVKLFKMLIKSFL